MNSDSDFEGEEPEGLHYSSDSEPEGIENNNDTDDNDSDNRHAPIIIDDDEIDDDGNNELQLEVEAESESDHENNEIDEENLENLRYSATTSSSLSSLEPGGGTSTSMSRCSSSATSSSWGKYTDEILGLGARASTSDYDSQDKVSVSTEETKSPIELETQVTQPTKKKRTLTQTSIAFPTARPKSAPPPARSSGPPKIDIGSSGSNFTTAQEKYTTPAPGLPATINKTSLTMTTGSSATVEVSQRTESSSRRQVQQPRENFSLQIDSEFMADFQNKKPTPNNRWIQSIKEHFQYLGHKNEKTIVLQCNYCHQPQCPPSDLASSSESSASGGKTSGTGILSGSKLFNFSRHLKNIHPDIQLVNHRESETNQNASVATFFPLKKNSKPKVDLKSGLQNTYKMAVLDMVAVDGLPLNFTTGLGFLNFMENLLPEINTQSDTTVTRHLKQKVLNDIIPKLKKLLSKVPAGCLHIIIDLWTSRMRKSVLGVRCQYLNADWEMILRTLGFLHFQTRHTGEEISKMLKKCLDSRGISPSQVGVVMADNASNITKACNMLLVFDKTSYHSALLDSTNFEADKHLDEVMEQDSDDESLENVNFDEHFTLDESHSRPGTETTVQQYQFKRLACLSHTLQLAINDALKIDKKSSELIAYCNKLIVFFRKHTYWNERLNSRAKKELFLPGVTRWNSVFLALERLSEMNVFIALQQLLIEVDSQTPKGKESLKPPTNFTRTKISDLLAILSPVKYCTDELQGNYCTSSLVIINLMLAFEAVYTISNKNYFPELIKELCKKMVTRFQHILCEEIYIKAAILDPEQKLRPFEAAFSEPPWMEDFNFHTVNAEDAKNLITNDLNQIVKDKSNLSPSQDTLPVAATVSGSKYRKEDQIASKQKRNAMDYLNSKVPVPEKNSNILTIRQELESYLGTGTDSEIDKKWGKNTSLYFWRKNAGLYPNLASLARKYLGVPASSGDVERMFSTAGSLQRARRAKLLPERIEEILLYREERLAVLKKKT